MSDTQSLHSICIWTFNAGKGGFVPADMRPEWDSRHLDVVGIIDIIKNKIAPRLPDNVSLGLEMHYDVEINEKNVSEVADALVDAGVSVAMVTPGAHSHWAYGGVSSLDPAERKNAEELGTGTVDIAYGKLKKAWHPDPDKTPTLVLWNGSFGYDIATPGIRQMYQNLKESVAKLCRYESEKGGALYIGFEPKPNEGHPALLIPTVASALLFWRKLEEEFGIPKAKKGVNKEFGHSEMIGLDHVYDTVEELDSDQMIHMHINSQGYNDGIILGGPGKYDIDHGARINGMNVSIARLLKDSGFSRWKGHDMQTRPYDNVEQGIDRVIRSILSWEACAESADELDTDQLMKYLQSRETAKAEDIMRDAVVRAQLHFNKIYK